MTIARGEQASPIQVRELFEALGINETQGRKLAPPGEPGDYISVDVALRWLDVVATAGGASGVRARFLRVRLILNSAGHQAGV
ncbi:MAG TPA: hypothetical protein VFS43_19790 [Polyangiaceae bacterium]|nr:hypothetical protein [Polyangiaceae bacterium]